MKFPEMTPTPMPICGVCGKVLVRMGTGMFSQYGCVYEQNEEHQRAYKAAEIAGTVVSAIWR